MFLDVVVFVVVLLLVFALAFVAFDLTVDSGSMPDDELVLIVAINDVVSVVSESLKVVPDVE